MKNSETHPRRDPCHDFRAAYIVLYTRGAGRRGCCKGKRSALLIIRTQEPIRAPRMDARRHNVSALLANDERHTLFVHFNFSFCECKIKQGMAHRANHADYGDRYDFGTKS